MHKTFFATLLLASGLAMGSALQAQPSDLLNLNISGQLPGLAASVPVIAIDPKNPRHIALIWRFIDPLGGSNSIAPGNWVCHMSVSQDGGASFDDHALDWGVGDRPRCNAPYATFNAAGILFAGGTLTGAIPSPPPASTPGNVTPIPGGAHPAEPPHPSGEVGIARSDDGGRSFGGTTGPIASDMLDRFEVGPEIPLAAKRVPWDGARGVIDLSSGTIFVTGAFPARPGGEDMSQRFLAASTDGGASFGPIRAFGNAEWPERWDGDIAAARGALGVSYIAASIPDKTVTCPCAVFGVSRDNGNSFTRSLVAPSAALDLDTIVHYPELAADTAHAGVFAMGLIDAQRKGISAYVTHDDGRNWTRLAAPLPADVVATSRPAVSFSPRGALVLAWRGDHPDGSYDIYAALERDGRFEPTVRISTASSHFPANLEKTYALRGDFHTGLAIDDRTAYVAWSDARDGKDVQLYYGRLPLAAMRGPAK